MDFFNYIYSAKKIIITDSIKLKLTNRNKPRPEGNLSRPMKVY